MTSGGIWLDAQGAQSREHFDRGIPRYVAEHVRALLPLAGGRVQAVGVDAEQPLIGNLGYLLDTPGLAQPRTAGQAPPSPLPAIHHLMSPIESRPLADLAPEWARRPEVTRVVTLYDLIPLVFADHYLRDPRVRLGYMLRLELIRSAHHVLAISEATAADAQERLSIPARRITVIDAGVASVFREASARPLPKRIAHLHDGFMLYVGGIEYRKNVERLILAYGRIDPALRARHQLVVTCKVTAAERERLERLAASVNVPHDEFILTGYVDDRELAALYAAARLFVFPSFYEGSGLPILEAMAAGLPVAASRTSTSPEILGDLDATFDPYDCDDMARVLVDTVTDEARLERLRARSRRRVRRYTWEHVAERTVAGYDVALAVRRSRRRPRRRRQVALLTPWPPERSGIADYNRGLVPELARHVDVDVIVDGRVDEHEPAATAGVRIRAHSAMIDWGRYDRILYCIGNSHFHTWILEALKARPGVVIAHDVRLAGGLYASYARQQRRDDPAAKLAAWIGEFYGSRVDASRWRERMPSPEEQAMFGIYMTADIQRCAHEIVVHSRHAAEILRLDRGCAAGPPVHVIPHAMPPVGPPGPPRREPLVVSLGVVGEAKGLQTLIEAFAEVSRRHAGARLVIAGDADATETARWRSLARTLGVADRVELVGYLASREYDALVARAAVAVQIRMVDNGEASGVVANNLAVGLPTVVTDHGWFRELPRDAVVHVPQGVAPAALASEIERLLVDHRHAETVSEAARSYAATTGHAQVARRYVRALLPQPAVRAPRELARATATVVVVAGGRREHVRLALEALERQTQHDFAVVVADDGSTDGTRELVEAAADRIPWAGRLRWLRVGDVPSGPSRARNAGAAHAAPGTSLLVFLDVDMLVPENALGEVLRHHREDPEAAIFPAIHWLPPLDLDYVRMRLRAGGAAALLEEVPRTVARRVAGTIVGPDPRGPAAFAVRSTVRPEHALTGFAAIPLRVWGELGGFDERMRGYGYEDMEFGIRLAQRGTRARMDADVHCLHMWHEKRNWPELSLQNECNLDYVLRKHGRGATSDVWADWSVWWHYHAERGGRVHRDPEGSLWAADHAARFRLALPGPEWVARLGHDPLAVESGEVGHLQMAGEARVLPIDRRDLPPAYAAGHSSVVA